MRKRVRDGLQAAIHGFIFKQVWCFPDSLRREVHRQIAAEALDIAMEVEETWTPCAECDDTGRVEGIGGRTAKCACTRYPKNLRKRRRYAGWE